MFDENWDCDFEIDEDERYGCDRCECCEDCPHQFECDGCGNLIYERETPARRTVSARKPGKRSAETDKKGSQEDTAPPKRTTKLAIWLVVGALVVLAAVLRAVLI